MMFLNLDERGPENKKKSAILGHSDSPSKKNSVTILGHSDSPSKKNSVAVGLRIVIQHSLGVSNVVVKPSLKLGKPTFQMGQIQASSHESNCFLKTCHLCNKNLSPDKDVYMYRGDQGYCSIECRSRQIYIDEIRERETSTKKILSSFRQCHSGGGRETRLLVEEFRQRHKPLSRRSHWAIVS